MEIVPGYHAFAARKSDGSITAWGSGSNGGDGEPKDLGYTKIVANNYAFVALKGGGKTLQVWGQNSYGGKLTTDQMLKILMP